jgi:YaiO family outer membrane protein
MHNYRCLALLLTIIVCALTCQTVSAQEENSPEAEYSRIRTLALAGNYSEAEPAARILVKENPHYGDARILLGRIVAWQGYYSEAAAIIDTLLVTEPNNSDALAALNDINRWSRDRSNQDTPPTDIRAGYFFDTYSEPYERFWQVFSLGAGHRFAWGSAAASVNMGNIFIGPPTETHDADIQFAAEAWPEISSRNYAYAAYAYSPGQWFPRHRAALEVWQTLPAGWAVSAGVNYYFFDRSVFIATVSAEKYSGNWWFSARGYLHFKEAGLRTSVYLYARRYFDRTDYLQLTLGAGTAPDEPIDIMTDLERQNATSIRLSYFNQLTSLWAFRVGAGYSYEKYDETGFRNRFEGGVSIIRGIGKRK